MKNNIQYGCVINKCLLCLWNQAKRYVKRKRKTRAKGSH